MPSPSVPQGKFGLRRLAVPPRGSKGGRDRAVELRRSASPPSLPPRGPPRRYSPLGYPPGGSLRGGFPRRVGVPRRRSSHTVSAQSRQLCCREGRPSALATRLVAHFVRGSYRQNTSFALCARPDPKSLWRSATQSLRSILPSSLTSAASGQSAGFRRVNKCIRIETTSLKSTRWSRFASPATVGFRMKR